MLAVYVKTGERIEIVKALDLGRGYRLLLVRDERGITSQVFSSEEIERFVTESDTEDESQVASG